MCIHVDAIFLYDPLPQNNFFPANSILKAFQPKEVFTKYLKNYFIEAHWVACKIPVNFQLKLREFFTMKIYSFLTCDKFNLKSSHTLSSKSTSLFTILPCCRLEVAQHAFINTFTTSAIEHSGPEQILALRFISTPHR